MFTWFEMHFQSCFSSLGYDNPKFDVKRQIGTWRGKVKEKHDLMYNKTGQGKQQDFSTHQLMIIDIFSNKSLPDSVRVIYILH